MAKSKKKEPEGSFSYFTNLSKRSYMLVRKSRNLSIALRLLCLTYLHVPTKRQNSRI